MAFILKTVLASLIISTASWLAGKRPGLAGFIISLPLTSMLGILFSYAEYKDMAKINEFAKSIFILVPLSLVFFLPFLLNKWCKMNFGMTYFLGIALLGAAYTLFSLFGGKI